MQIKAKTITIIGKTEYIQDFLTENKSWLVFSAEKSKKIPDYDVIKLLKQGDLKNVDKCE